MELNGLAFDYEPRTIFRAHETWRPFSESGTWLYGREPILRAMPDGGLVCWIYSGGPREPHNDNVVLIARSSDRGETWSEPELLFRHGARAAWGTEIFTECEVPFGVVNTFDARCHYLELRAGLTYTKDSGRTWSDPVAPHGIPAGVNLRQGIVLGDGAWLFPVYWQELRGGWNWADSDAKRPWPLRCGAVRSEDAGESFSLHGCLWCADSWLWEPNAVETEAGVWMLMRAEGTGVLYESWSRDGGLTWSPAEPTDIPNPGTKLTLLNVRGRVVLLHNPTSPKLGRKRIELWASEDGGSTWAVRRRLVEVAGQNTAEYGGGRMICYPHGFAADTEELLYVAVDTKDAHYLLRVPYADFL